MEGAVAQRDGTLRLRDGSAVVVRPIQADDKERLLAAFNRLSPESRYRRFLTPLADLTPAMLAYLTEVDHHDHEAIVAIDAATGAGVGVARYVRWPQRRDSAEAAVTVVDDWQGRGVGTMLLELLTGRAREEGIRSFTALLLGTNDEMIDMLERLGPTDVVDRQLGTVELEIELPDVGLSEPFRQLLRACGSAPAPPARTGSLLPRFPGPGPGARRS